MSNKEKKQGKIKAFFTSRKAKKGSVAVIILAAAVAIVVLVNIITGILVDRFPNLNVDMTSSGTYQLQKDTVDYIKQLDKDVSLSVMVTEKTFKSGMNAYEGAQYFVQANELLKKMAACSDHVSLKYVDLSANPTYTNKYKNVDWNSADANTLMIVESGDDYTALSLDECFTLDTSNQYYQYYGYSIYTATTIEQAVVTAVLEVTTGQRTEIDILTGSGESEDAYSALKTLFKQNAYNVKEVNILTEKPSDDAKALLMYAPTVDISEDASAKIEKWLKNGGEYGKTLIYIPINSDVETPNIDKLLKNYGLKVSDGLGFCTNSQYVISDYYTFITDYNNDEYKKGLKNPDVPVVVRDTRDVEVIDESIASPLLSVESGAGVVPFENDGNGTAEDYMKAEGINAAAIGANTSGDDKKSNIIVFGSPMMFLSAYMDTSYNNANYIINLCNIVTNRGDMGITITSAKQDNGELGTVTEATTALVAVIFIGAIPIIILLIGLIVFIRRRAK